MTNSSFRQWSIALLISSWLIMSKQPVTFRTCFRIQTVTVLELLTIYRMCAERHSELNNKLSSWKLNDHSANSSAFLFIKFLLTINLQQSQVPCRWHANTSGYLTKNIWLIHTNSVLIGTKQYFRAFWCEQSDSTANASRFIMCKTLCIFL